MKPLSQQLSDLSVRAKKAEADVTTAKTEEHSKIEARVQKLHADAAARTAKVDAAAAAAKDKTVEQWTTLQKQIKAHNERVRADIAANKAEHEASRALRKADRAEDNAAAAIAFAYDAIEYAESAALDAVMARSDADALR
jgi:ribulose 1,5-bisphosphate carboxylase large subunit-like protein